MVQFAPFDVNSVSRQPGLLESISRALDTPGRIVRSALIRESDATGADVLEKLFGLKNKRGQFDAADIPAFLTEVALDPLTYVGGLGALTKGAKGGRAAKEAARLRGIIKAAEEATPAGGAFYRQALANADDATAKLSQLLAKAGGEIPEYAGRLGDDAARGLRSLVSIDIPFTDIEIPLIKGGLPLGFLGKSSAALGQTRPIQVLGKAFNANFGKPKDFTFQALEEAAQQTIRRGGKEAVDLAGETTKALSDLTQQGVDPETIRRGIEVRDTPSRISEFINKRQLGDAVDRETGRPLGVKPKEWGRIVKTKKNVAEVDAALKGSTEAQSRFLISELGGQLDKTRDELIRSGATRSDFDLRGDSLLSYFPRRINGQVREVFRRFPDLQESFKKVVERIQRTSFSNPSSLSRRKDEALDFFTDEFSLSDFLKKGGGAFVNDLFANKKALKMLGIEDSANSLDDVAKNLFEGNAPLAVAETYAEQMARSAIADQAHATARTFALPAEAIPRGRGVPLAEYLADTGLHKYIPQGETDRVIDLSTVAGDAEGIARVLKENGVVESAIPMDVYREMTKFSRTFSAPSEVIAMTRRAMQVTGIIKSSLTRPFPAYHVRNVLSDTILNILAGAANPKQLWRSLMAAAGKNPDDLVEMQIYGALHGTSNQAIREQMKGLVGDELLEIEQRIAQGTDPAGIAKVFREAFGGKLKGPVDKGTQAYKVYTEFGERFTRAWHYYSRKAAGDTPSQAAESVRNYLFDYSKGLTEFEKRFVNPTVLFYSWTRLVLPRLFKSFVDDQKTMRLLLRASGAPTADRGEGPLPGFLENTAAIPINKDKGIYLQNIGSPLEEINKFDIKNRGGFAEGVSQVFKRIATQLNPLIKTPIEIASGQDFFLDRPLSEVDRVGPTLGKLFGERQELPGGQVRYRMDPAVGQILRGAPFGRAFTTVDQIADIVNDDYNPRESRWLSAAGLAGASKPATVDALDRARAEEAAIKEALLGKIRSGQVGTFEGVFDRGNADETAKALLERLRDVKERKKEIYKLTER